MRAVSCVALSFGINDHRNLAAAGATARRYVLLQRDGQFQRDHLRALARGSRWRTSMANSSRPGTTGK